MSFNLWLFLCYAALDEFLGAASSSRLDFKTPEESSLSPVSTTAPVFTALSGPDAEIVHVSGNKDIIDIPQDHDVTPSISSESVTLITQIENLGAVETVQDNAAEEIAKKLTEASLEEADLTQSLLEDHGRLPETDRITDSEVHASHLGDEKPKEATEAKATAKPETVKEDGPTDLRVFELNSDSGKSTPSNNGKKGNPREYSTADAYFKCCFDPLCIVFCLSSHTGDFKIQKFKAST